MENPPNSIQIKPDPGDPDPKPNRLTPCDNIVGKKIRELRARDHLSLRELAAHSNLNINTLSLIETGKSSPSVSTLQHLAQALDVPITAFFESEPVQKRVVYTRQTERPLAEFEAARMQNLGKDLAGNAVQPFIVTLGGGAGSGPSLIVHAGYEFVYCLSGCVAYQVEGERYLLEAGDSLVFESHIPHRWENAGETESQILLIFYPADQREAPGGRHFQLE